MRSSAILVVAVTILHISCTVFAYSYACGGCKPWHPSMPCDIGKQMVTKIMADVNPAYVDETPYNGTSYVTYGFCQEVDELQALHISGFINDTMLSDTGSFGPNATAYLRMYGLGAAANGPPAVIPQFPGDTDSSTAVLAWADPTVCPGGIAVANFLVLNITLKDGFIHYRDNGSPLFTGFQSTCSGGVCLFGPSGPEYPCIGNGQSSNCARCLYNTTNLQNLTVSVWVSYYGTDASGTPMTSGQENPLNFREFAMNSAYDSLANDVSIP
jgi:hypothetical protein